MTQEGFGRVAPAPALAEPGKGRRATPGKGGVGVTHAYRLFSHRGMWKGFPSQHPTWKPDHFTPTGTQLISGHRSATASRRASFTAQLPPRRYKPGA